MSISNDQKKKTKNNCNFLFDIKTVQDDLTEIAERFEHNLDS